ncbi:hypothetical protein ACFU99_40230, partial [Streptomyces sp. NPDC057654]|uniref:hypothetical protein n=1 Tax=Streptomyces sp. NPDC057654 TaxID=3346196 RepID=UPI0036AEB516
MKKDSKSSKDSTEPGPSAGAANSRRQGDRHEQRGRRGEDGGAAGPQGSAHAGSYDGPNTGPSTGTRMRAIWHGEGIPMDMLFRDDRDGYGHGPAPVEERDAPGPLQADRPGSHVAVIDGGRGPAVEPEETGGETAAGEGARAPEDDTTEQPLILVPLIDPDTGKEFVYPPDLADPAPAVRRQAAAKPEKAAVSEPVDSAYAPASASAQVPAPARTEDAPRTEDTPRAEPITRTEDTATAIAGIAAATALADAAGRRPDSRDADADAASTGTGRGARTGGGDRDVRMGGGPGASGGRNRRRAEPRPET